MRGSESLPAPLILFSTTEMLNYGLLFSIFALLGLLLACCPSTGQARIHFKVYTQRVIIDLFQKQLKRKVFFLYAPKNEEPGML